RIENRNTGISYSQPVVAQRVVRSYQPQHLEDMPQPMASRSIGAVEAVMPSCWNAATFRVVSARREFRVRIFFHPSTAMRYVGMEPQSLCAVKPVKARSSHCL